MGLRGVDAGTPIESSDDGGEEEEMEENSSWQLDGTYGSSFSNGQEQRDANWCLPQTPPYSGARLDPREDFPLPNCANNGNNSGATGLGGSELGRGTATLTAAPTTASLLNPA